MISDFSNSSQKVPPCGLFFFRKKTVLGRQSCQQGLFNPRAAASGGTRDAAVDSLKIGDPVDESQALAEISRLLTLTSS